MICPNCGKSYEPRLKRKYLDVPIQQEFPNAKPIDREQLVSGICSDKCWNEFIGRQDLNEPEIEDNEKRPFYKKIFRDRRQ